jgi:hypothetical protein
MGHQMNDVVRLPLFVDVVRFGVWSHQVQKHIPDPTPTT